jgi:hypothetical protein
MYKYLLGLCLVALTGCMSVPSVDGVQGTISCGSLETLTGKTTLVYVYLERIRLILIVRLRSKLSEELASLAQLVELLHCKHQVVGSNPTGGSKHDLK